MGLAALAGWLLCGAGSCTQQGGAGLYQRLQGQDPDARIKAMVEAVRLKDQNAVPYIVESLGSGDAEVRFAAFMSLKDLTGQTMGYEIYQPRADREKAIKLWREWLAGGRQPSATNPATEPAAVAASGPASGPATAPGAVPATAAAPAGVSTTRATD